MFIAKFIKYFISSKEVIFILFIKSTSHWLIIT